MAQFDLSENKKLKQLFFFLLANKKYNKCFLFKVDSLSNSLSYVLLACSTYTTHTLLLLDNIAFRPRSCVCSKGKKASLLSAL